MCYNGTGCVYISGTLKRHLPTPFHPFHVLRRLLHSVAVPIPEPTPTVIIVVMLACSVPTAVSSTTRYTDYFL